MAADKKTPSKKPAAKKSGPKAASRKRSASRPPTIELKADEVVDKSVLKAEAEKTRKPLESTPKKEEPAKKATDEKKSEEVRSEPPIKKSKTPLIAASLAGLIAGTAGGLVAGFILTGSGGELGTGENLGLLEERLQKIETGQKAAQPTSNLLPRIDKAESDFRFLNTQLGTLQKDILALKEQLAVFSSTLTPSPDGAGTLPAPSVDVSSLREKITELETQLKIREQQGVALSAKLEGLQKSLEGQASAQKESAQKTQSAALETSQAYAALKQDVDEKINKLYQASGDNRIRAAALSLSLRQLSIAVKGTAPFEAEVEALGSLLGGNALLEDIKPYAAKGALNLAGLKTEFAKVKLTPAAKTSAPSGSTLLDKFVSNAKSVVRIRKVGEGGEAPQDPLIALKQKLAAGDLAGVLKLGGELEPKVKEAYQPWLEQVKTRVSLDGVAAKLQNAILAEIGKSTSKAPSQKPQAPSEPDVKPVTEVAPAEPSKPLVREEAQ